MLLNCLACFIRMPTLSQLALKSPLYMIFCIPFLPPNSKMVNWLNQYNTKSNCQWNIPLHWYFSTRSSKAGAISIRWLSRLLPSCLSRDPHWREGKERMLEGFLDYHPRYVTQRFFTLCWVGVCAVNEKGDYGEECDLPKTTLERV